MSQSFILNLHDEESSKVRLLREEEEHQVSGGGEGCPPRRPIPTMTVTPNGDGGDDGCDSGGSGNGSAFIWK